MIKIKSHDIFLIILLIIILNTFILLKIFAIKSTPILLDYVRNESNNIINSFINESLSKIIHSHSKNIIELDKNNNGDIVSLNFNNNEINQFLYDITNDVLNNLSKLEEGNYRGLNIKNISNEDAIYYVPSGIVFENSLMSLLGPKIPFKINLIGNINSETENSIKEYGINSSMIEVFLNIRINYQIILPFKSEIFTINKRILLESKIIQGNIPDYYGGLIQKSIN